jgi:two-component system sensor histidine kinase LytS
VAHDGAPQPEPPRRIPHELEEWLLGRLDRDPEISPSELLVTLIRGGLRPRDDYDAVLDLLVEALPPLRGGLHPASAAFTAKLLHERLRLDAASVLSRDAVLAFVGTGADHHGSGAPDATVVAQRALASGEVTRADGAAAIGCTQPECPLSSALIAPLVVRKTVVGALGLYHSPGRMLTDRDAKIAGDLARVLSVYLELGELDARAALATRAKLEALRAQISPHFLFNTLTALAALTRTDPDRAHDLLLDFAESFRDMLAQRGETVLLRDELALVERYLRFAKLRFGERLSVEYEIDPRALDAHLPLLVLQPLVENAIVHGTRGERCFIRLAARPLRDGFEITVADDGPGIPRAELGSILERGRGTGLGVALNNIDQRLTGIFGSRSGLRITSRPGRGTTVRIWLPRDLPPDGAP